MTVLDIVSLTLGPLGLMASVCFVLWRIRLPRKPALAGGAHQGGSAGRTKTPA